MQREMSAASNYSCDEIKYSRTSKKENLDVLMKSICLKEEVLLQHTDP